MSTMSTAFEILEANEFHRRDSTCSQVVRAYQSIFGSEFICSQRGAIADEYTVSGDKYIWDSFNYTYNHVWRNFGILIAFLVGFLAL